MTYFTSNWTHEDEYEAEREIDGGDVILQVALRAVIKAECCPPDRDFGEYETQVESVSAKIQPFRWFGGLMDREGLAAIIGWGQLEAIEKEMADEWHGEATYDGRLSEAEAA